MKVKRKRTTIAGVLVTIAAVTGITALWKLSRRKSLSKIHEDNK